MNFEYEAEEKEFQKEVRVFFQREKLTEEVRKEVRAGLGYGPATWEMLKKLGSKGWLAPTWPKKYGGLELPDIYRYIVMEEISFWTELSALVGAGMAGPTILGHGSEEQKEEYLPKIARGEIDFALGYTEPEAGSDLANLEIRAEDKGDYFLMNGQKMFNTGCHFANYHWLGARTAEKGNKKHRGISLFIVDLSTPGISLDPIWTISKMRTNMVYYDNVEVPKDALVGEKNRGFYYIMEALDYERIYYIGKLQRLLDEIVEMAKERGKNKDPYIRKTLAELRTRLEIARLFALRIPWILGQGRTPNYEAAMLKIVYGELQNDIINAGTNVLGLYGLLTENSKWTVANGQMEWWYREAPRDLATRGTCEVMRNIIAGRGLGLPSK
jgi:hypothetical protein